MPRPSDREIFDAITEVETIRYSPAGYSSEPDLVAIEEPLEIQLRGPEAVEFRQLSLTMRTPGHDRELAVGFLFNEGVVRGADDIQAVELWGPLSGEAKVQNICRVTLRSEPSSTDRLERHFYTNSSCGVCGRLSMEALHSCAAGPLPQDGPRTRASLVLGLPKQLRGSQVVFDQTGGLHATALFTEGGELIEVFEDVGRHNAMDKMAGALLFRAALPASSCMLTVSGRLSFELVQKAVMMGVPILCGIGAPSSLAINVARKANLTLIGFLRDSRFNVYANEWRIDFAG